MKKEKYLLIQFKHSSRLNVYKFVGDFKVGDVVEAPINNYTMNEVGLVKKIKRLTGNNLSVEYQRILTITKKLNANDYAKDFFPIKFMKSYIKPSLIKEWWFDYKNDWVEVYSSKFGGCISYEKDSVLTGSLYKCTDENYFEEYTQTNRKNFKIKLRYLQAILTELHYNKINESEFMKLLSVI